MKVTSPDTDPMRNRPLSLTFVLGIGTGPIILPGLSQNRRYRSATPAATRSQRRLQRRPSVSSPRLRAAKHHER